MFEVISLGNIKTVSTKSSCNHVYVVDISGSMYGSLEKIRQHLKNIITVVAQPTDTFSTIWFSGRGQAGVVFENILVSDVSSISMMHTAIDRYLKPMGLTGFVDPIELALNLKLDPTKVNNFIMLTDGYDNQSSRANILSQVQRLPSVYPSVSFIEYGFYADRDLLSQMAELVGGTHIFADGINKYEQVMESVVSNVTRVPNVEVTVNKKAKSCMYVVGDQIRIVDVNDGVASVPADVDQVYSVVPSDVLSKQLSDDHLYMVLYYATKTSNSDLVWKTLQALGDVELVEKYQNAFTKQELSTFEESVAKAVFDETIRFVKGRDVNAVPDKNAPTIIDLLKELADPETKSFLVTDSPFWSYEKIGRSSTREEELPKFVPSPMSRVSLNSLTFNSSRPNVSVQTNLGGVVQLPENDHGLKTVPSFITRNYTIIKDGIRNMDKLPIVFNESAKAAVEKFAHDVVQEDQGVCYWVFDLSKIPVINRAMVETVSKTQFVKNIEYMESNKATLKVLGHLIKESGGSDAKIKGMKEQYGEEAANWLSGIGVRDYGFSPVGSKSAEATDEYESIKVDYKIKGLSSLPAINKVEEKITKGSKLNIADLLIKQNLDKLSSLDKSDLEEQKVFYTKSKRNLEAALAKDVYTLVLGRKWFGDDEVATADVNISGEASTMTIEKVREMVKV